MQRLRCKIFNFLTYYRDLHNSFIITIRSQSIKHNAIFAAVLYVIQLLLSSIYRKFCSERVAIEGQDSNSTVGALRLMHH
jgi:hypothetical protein